MHRGPFVSLAIALSLLGCGPKNGSGDGDGDGSGDTGDDGDDGDDSNDANDDDGSAECPPTVPVRDEWRVEFEGDLDLVDEDNENAPRITNIIVGTPDPFGDNFMNRGDIIVDFTGEPDRIKIELRRFTFACEDTAQETFDKLWLWAFNENTSAPKRPAEMSEDADCTDTSEAWLDGCGIYVYYDGQNQLERAGADIRVTLPPDYRQSIDILATDNLVEDSYPNHGNVCVNNLHATADITLQNGIALVKLAPDATPAPACPPAQLADCTDVDDPTTIAGMQGLWSANCACAQQLQMGSLAIEADAPFAADVIVDAPADLWLSLTAENEAGGGEPECPVAMSGYGGDFVPDPAQSDPDEPWRVLGDANKPSDAALAGGGYALKLTSSSCQPVASIETPEAYEPDGELETQTRGFVTLCNGCLADDPCADLPGG
jgi:hypothetical protein